MFGDLIARVKWIGVILVGVLIFLYVSGNQSALLSVAGGIHNFFAAGINFFMTILTGHGSGGLGKFHL